jgi:predicted thioesterase
MNIGDKFTMPHTVADNETAQVLGSGGLPVYSTPSMICLMELAAYKLAEAAGHQTVGTKVQISHLRACLPGTEVTAEAELVEMEGRKLTYRVSVCDANGVMGEGRHERFIIDPERFMAKLR